MAVVMVIVRSTLVVTLALCALLVTVACAAQAAEPAALSRGSQALQFGVGYDFKLGPFQGGTIAYERFVRDRLAMRLGAQISMDYYKGPFVVEESRGGLNASAEVDLAEWEHAYSVSCHLVSYRTGRVALYYGGGPKATYSNSLDEYYNFYLSTDGVSSHRDRMWRRSWAAGLEGVMGVQWILNDRFRLLGQYATAVMYGRRFRESTSTYTSSGELPRMHKDTDDRYLVEIAPQAVQLGLAVSF